MATHYNKIVEDLGNIVPAIEYYEKQLEEARWEVKIKGSLEKSSAALPGITEYRFNQLQEIEAILEHLNIALRKERSQVFRKYFETYNRQLSSRDAEKYVDGEDDVVDMDKIINDFALIRNQWLGITKGLDQKQWQITNIVKLRVAGMEDADIK